MLKEDFGREAYCVAEIEKIEKGQLNWHVPLNKNMEMLDLFLEESTKKIQEFISSKSLTIEYGNGISPSGNGFFAVEKAGIVFLHGELSIKSDTPNGSELFRVSGTTSPIYNSVAPILLHYNSKKLTAAGWIYILNNGFLVKDITNSIAAGESIRINSSFELL